MFLIRFELSCFKDRYICLNKKLLGAPDNSAQEEDEIQPRKALVQL